MSDELRARIEQALARAEAATPGPWQWVDPITDEPGTPSGSAYRASLRTVARYPTFSVGPLPKFVIDYAEADEWNPADAAFIAAAREDVPAFARALCEVLALHRGLDDNGPAECRECLEPYPCPTVRAIAAALEEPTDA